MIAEFLQATGEAMGVANETIMPVSRQQEAVTKLSAVVGENLRHLRRRNGLSLEQLAHLSGVSRAMLGQIESGKSAPTINLLGRIADALKVSVPSLISNSSSASTVVVLREKATIVSSGEGGFTCRALFPWGDPQSIEIYEVTIAPHHSERISAHSAGTRKALVVVTGEVEVIVADYSPARLCAGDAVLFNADTEHRLRNAGATEAKAFLVVTAADGSCSRVRAF